VCSLDFDLMFAQVGNYCTGEDRRIYPEHEKGIPHTGACDVHSIPKGSFDCGDGYYDPESRIIWSYDASTILREPTAKELTWILARTRQATA
jgi:hypothetical protein